MNPANLRSIGDQIVAVQSVFPQSSVAATLNGSSIDRVVRNLPLSCVLHQAIGAVTGSPSAISVQTAIQHSADNSSWATYVPNLTTSQTPALVSANMDNATAVNLTSAMRYIRAVTVVGFTGGSAPAAVVAAEIIIGGESIQAAI